MLHEGRIIRSRIRGIVCFVDESAPYCFIHTLQRESFYCRRSDLGTEITDGSKVEFDVITSFDHKKQKESLMAVNIRLAPVTNIKHEIYLEAMDEQRYLTNNDIECRGHMYDDTE